MAESSPPVPEPPIPDPDVTQDMEPSELVRLLDQYMAELKTGAVPDRAKLLADHPELASQLEQCLAGIELIHRAGMPAGSPTQLGDFRILRELGRGGMGVVFEAEQISLRRRVALKVLRFGTVADKEALERFQREGETIAHLHHTNIVPIFAIGSEHGVAFYAMQLIDGGSLADVTARQTAAGGAEPDEPTAPFTEIARWGMEAAEALAHAHQRGVIHRDVKPSNLLLDTDGRVWLTDFGLARRMDDVTLTMMGLAGTPRYMSPEQAAAIRRPIDHRTDIYSLGATLYELATGGPLFASETAHGMISQILTTEPARPRIIRPSIPRDLETIVLKCLSKEPAQRYATAQALADDLRAFREGRAVKARRARLPERAVRWIKSRKKSMAVGAVAAAITLMVTAGLYVAWHSYAAAQIVHVDVGTAGPHLKVEVFDEVERDLVATFTAPTQEAQALPPGKYHMRFSADGRLSETSLFDAAAGGKYQLTAALSPREPWEIPIGGNEVVETARMDGRDDLFLALPHKLRRLRGDTGQSMWEISLTAYDQPLVAKALNAPDGDVFSLFSFGTPTALVRPLADLDGDGTPDLIWASRSSASLVAISGNTGKVLWCHRGQTVPARGPHPSQYETPAYDHEKIMGQPLMAEVDGKKVVVAMYSIAAPHPHPQWWLEGISAVTGELLWRRLVLPNDPWDERFPCDTSVSVCGKLHGRTIGAIAYGNRLVGFDFLTGEPAWPDRVIDAVPSVGTRFCDLLGDGQIAVLFVRLGGSKGYDSYWQVCNLSVVALSPLSPAPLWERPLPGVALPAQAFQADGLFDWPLVVDLTGKGHPEVVVPYVDSAANSCGLEVLDGRTGVTRWKHRLSGVNQSLRQAQPDRMIAGPDLAGDGCRELFVASCDEKNHRAYIDALAGSDGRSRWTYNQPIDGGKGLWWPPRWWQSLRWWQAGRDGRAMLVATAPTGSLLMLASTGHVEHILNGFGDPQIADLNGDGIPDLFAYGPENSNRTAGTPVKGKLRVIRGMPPTAWRMLSSDSLVPTQDLNGDGIADLVFSQGKKAISGKDGSVLWKNDAVASPAYSGQTADVMGDGTPVLFSVASGDDKKSVALRAASGRDGKPLWAAEFKTGAAEFATGVDERQISVTSAVLGCPVFEGGGSPDVLFLFTKEGPEQANVGGRTAWCWLARISGHDGKLRWRHSLSEPDALGGQPGPVTMVDRDGDGVNDIVFWVPLDRGDDIPATISRPAAKDDSPNGVARYELRAYSGRDGKLLWRRPGFYDERGLSSHLRKWPQMPRPLSINDNGHPLVLITDVQFGKESGKSYAQVVAVDGRNGKTVWSWRGDDGSVMDQNANWANGSPQAARTSAGPAIVVSVFNKNDTAPFHHIVQLDTGGHVLTRTDVLKDDNVVPAPSYTTASHFSPGSRPRVWVYDLDGDGLDELVWGDMDGSVDCIYAVHAGSGASLWESKRGFWNGADIREILPAGKNRPATIAVNGYEKVVGLAGPTGKICWQYESPQPANAVLLETSDPLGFPRVFERSTDGQSNCRLVLPADDAGVYLPAAPMEGDRPEPAVDPRLLLPLPWTSGQFEKWPISISSGLLFSIGTIAAVILAYRRPRRWRRIAGLFACLLGLAIFELVGAVGWFWYAPYVVMAIATVIWAWRRRHRGRWIVGLIVCWVGLTVLVAAGFLWFDARRTLPGERYDWSDWQRGIPLLFLLGVAATTGLLLASGLFRLISRSVERRWNKSIAGAVVADT